MAEVWVTLEVKMFREKIQIVFPYNYIHGDKTSSHNLVLEEHNCTKVVFMIKE